MSRDHKILAGSAIVQVVIAIAKNSATTPDAMIQVAKDEAIPVGISVASLWLLFKFIK